MLNNKPEKIFADTGNEAPETYEYLQYYPHPVTILNNPVQGFKSLKEYCLYYKTAPMRHFRWCTDKFKTKRIEKYIRSKTNSKEIIQYIGIAYEERHRVKINKRGRFIFKYPLVEQGIDRDKCIEIIEENNLKVPPKSGCWFCPFQTKTKWLKLLQEHPDLYQEAVIIDELSPQIKLYDRGLRNLRGRVNLGLEQKTIFEKDEKDDWECQFCMIV